MNWDHQDQSRLCEGTLASELDALSWESMASLWLSCRWARGWTRSQHWRMLCSQGRMWSWKVDSGRRADEDVWLIIMCAHKESGRVWLASSHSSSLWGLSYNGKWETQPRLHWTGWNEGDSSISSSLEIGRSVHMDYIEQLFISYTLRFLILNTHGSLQLFT